MLPRLLIVITLIALLQNTIAVALSRVMRLDSLVGMCTGSIPMLGGHGTSAAFGPLLEENGIPGAATLCTAAATFGLIAGSLIGSPADHPAFNVNLNPGIPVTMPCNHFRSLPGHLRDRSLPGK